MGTVGARGPQKTIDDTAASVLTGHLVRAAGETVAGGPYAITLETLAADSNYTLSITGSTLAGSTCTSRDLASHPAAAERSAGVPAVSG